MCMNELEINLVRNMNYTQKAKKKTYKKFKNYL